MSDSASVTGTEAGTGGVGPGAAEQDRGRIRLLITDDHPVVRSGLRGLLEAQPDFQIVAEARDGTEAVEAAGRLRPDVVIMDLNMPRMNGATATRRITKTWPDTRVLILTTFELDTDIERAVENGAAGCVLKDAPHDGICTAIRQVAAGGAPMEPRVVARLLERTHAAKASGLSAREVEILRLVAKGTSNKVIARELWISETTVKSHLRRIYDKLETPDRTAAVTLALKRGIISLTD